MAGSHAVGDTVCESEHGQTPCAGWRAERRGLKAAANPRARRRLRSGRGAAARGGRHRPRWRVVATGVVAAGRSDHRAGRSSRLSLLHSPHAAFANRRRRPPNRPHSSPTAASIQSPAWIRPPALGKEGAVRNHGAGRRTLARKGEQRLGFGASAARNLGVIQLPEGINRSITRSLGAQLLKN